MPKLSYQKSIVDLLRFLQPLKSNSSSYIIISSILLIITLWMVSGDQLLIYQGALSNKTSNLSHHASEPTMLPVRAIKLRAQDYQPVWSLKGITEPWRSITVRTRTTGKVAIMYAQQGQLIEQDGWIAQLSTDDRPARIKAATSALAQNKNELKAALKLGFSGNENELRRVASEAGVKSSQAELAAAILDIQHSELKSPFKAFVHVLHITKGDVLQQGDKVAQLIDTHKMKAVVHVSERNLSKLNNVKYANFITFDNHQYSGEIIFTSPKANTKHATFRVEIAIENPQRILRAGSTGTITFHLPKVRAYQIPHDAIISDDNGQLGVLVVDHHRTKFQPIKIIATKENGVWIHAQQEELLLVGSQAHYLPLNTLVKPTLSPSL